MKTFSLQEIGITAKELKFEVISQSENQISVKLADDWTIVFENIENEDAMVYFENSCEWHTHGSMFETDGIELNDVPMMIMMKLIDGDFLLIEQQIKRTGYKIDRYFDDKEGIIRSLKYIEPGETIKIQRLNQN